MVYPGSGHHGGVKPYSCLSGYIACGAIKMRTPFAGANLLTDRDSNSTPPCPLWPEASGEKAPSGRKTPSGHRPSLSPLLLFILARSSSAQREGFPQVARRGQTMVHSMLTPLWGARASAVTLTRKRNGPLCPSPSLHAAHAFNHQNGQTTLPRLWRGLLASSCLLRGGAR